MKKGTNLKVLSSVLILAAVLIVSAGCTAAPGGPAVEQTQAGGTAAPTQAAVSPTQAVESTAALPNTGGNTVQVQLKEYTITMPASIPAGHTVFEVTNVGTEEHGFDIEGQGVDAGLERHLKPGESMTLEVDLAAGTYEAYCPVDNHAGKGMKVDLTVTAP